MTEDPLPTRQDVTAALESMAAGAAASLQAAVLTARKVNGLGSYLTRDAILKAAVLKTEDVPVPEWGGSVLVRELRGRERDEWEASLAVQRGQKMVPDVANMRAKLVARTVIDADGEPVFTQQDVSALGELSAAALDRVFEVASRLSALNPDQVEELGKNSGTAP